MKQMKRHCKGLPKTKVKASGQLGEAASLADYQGPPETYRVPLFSTRSASCVYRYLRATTLVFEAHPVIDVDFLRCELRMPTLRNTTGCNKRSCE